MLLTGLIPVSISGVLVLGIGIFFGRGLFDFWGRMLLSVAEDFMTGEFVASTVKLTISLQRLGMLALQVRLRRIANVRSARIGGYRESN